MAEQSLFWQTNGTGHGPAGGYSQQRLYDWLRKIFITDVEASEGVLANVGGQLTVTGTASPLSCSDGAGVGYGFFYENTSSKNLTVTTPSIGVTGGRVNLRVDWTAQTATVVAIRSADGTPAFPALVQSAGSTWDVPLYTFSITTGGVITLTDVRSFCHFATKIASNMIDAGAVDNAAIRDGAGVSVIGRSANSTGDVADIAAGANDRILARVSNALSWVQLTIGMIPDLLITEAKLAAVVAAKLVTGGNAHDHIGGDGATIATGAIANDAVDDTKVGNRVIQFPYRKGGSAVEWNTNGSTNYQNTHVRMYAGAFQCAAMGSVVITYQTAFSNAPLVFISDNSPGSNSSYQVSFSSSWEEDFRFSDTSNSIRNIHWLAIGPD